MRGLSIGVFGFIMLLSIDVYASSIVSDSVSSSTIGQRINVSVYLPSSYTLGTKYYPVMYLLNGYGGDETQWPGMGMQSIVDAEISAGRADEMIIVMPAGLDSFYCDTYSSIRYETFMVNELIPTIESKYRIDAKNGASRAIAGLSMGGYGTTYHSFKYATMYSSAYAMSAAFDVGGTPDIRSIVQSKSPSVLPAYTMEIGTSDFLYDANTSFRDFLNQQGVTFTYIERAGTHNAEFWIECLPKAVQFASKYFTSPTSTCHDGIQNQGETGVDCGGPCSPCEQEPKGCTCPAGCDSPVDGSVPFTHDGAADTCYFFSNLGDHINSWNFEAVNLNGLDITNNYVNSDSYPALVDGGYYLYLKSNYFWSHIEIR